MLSDLCFWEVFAYLSGGCWCWCWYGVGAGPLGPHTHRMASLVDVSKTQLDPL